MVQEGEHQHLQMAVRLKMQSTAQNSQTHLKMGGAEKHSLRRGMHIETSQFSKARKHERGATWRIGWKAHGRIFFLLLFPLLLLICLALSLSLPLSIYI